MVFHFAKTTEFSLSVTTGTDNRNQSADFALEITFQLLVRQPYPALGIITKNPTFVTLGTTQPYDIHHALFLDNNSVFVKYLSSSCLEIMAPIRMKSTCDRPQLAK
jgi:hypothetical protein